MKSEKTSRNHYPQAVAAAVGQTAAALCFALLALLAGCSTDDAHNLVVPNADYGRCIENMAGTDDQLIVAGKIDLHSAVRTHDGQTIDVWVILSRNGKTTATSVPAAGVKPSRGTVVLLHPLMTSKVWFLDLGSILAERGWDVVLMDLRAHGRSTGTCITWGAKEKYDVKAVMDSLLSQNLVSSEIYAVGASLGGMVAIQYGAIDDRCRGVLAAAAPASARDACRRIMLMHSNERFEQAFAHAAEYAGFDPNDASSVTAASRLHGPLLLVHGNMDFVVPLEHSRMILKAAPPDSRLIELLGSGHAPEIWSDNWFADRIDDLQKMAHDRGNRPSASSQSKAQTR